MSERARSILAAILLIVGAVLAPIAAIGANTRAQLVSTDTFVATYGSLAQDPAVVDALAAAVGERVEVATDSDVATALARATTREVVSSDAFGSVWEGMLRGAHAGVSAVVDGDGALSVNDGGELTVNVSTIVGAVRDQLVTWGFEAAERIAADQEPLVLVQSDEVALALQAYQATATVGAWLPWVSLALLAAGVLLAVDRRRALGRAGWVVFALTGVAWATVLIVRGVLGSGWPAVSAVAAAATGGMVVSLAIITLVALAVAVGVTWWRRRGAATGSPAPGSTEPTEPTEPSAPARP
ncbi:hypothetical protein [Serinibacter salmoneus]|uniref:Uncharacterized protein n=1 Tax=Serinibacter salmoneus TaxID=556530 RepID=A0A2A9D4L2_9MICO|nr:hypothetical protein [Serinibacter salmoneus]PFG20892.1 hypothetical protein ATL40_2507 [Serinibacter salmoneus]